MRRYLVLLVAVLLVACSGESTGGMPTLTFDGAAATYSGPTTLDAGPVTFRLENQSDVRAGFLWGRHVDKSDLPALQSAFDFYGIEVPEDGVFTREYMDLWDRYSRPPWVEETHDFPELRPQTTIESTTDLTVGRYELLGFDNDAEEAYPAAIIEVVDE